MEPAPPLQPPSTELRDSAPLGAREASLWAERVGGVAVAKAEMNRLVMDFFESEGYQEAAGRFAAESGTPAGLELDLIGAREQLRNFVRRGEIQAALDKVDPALLAARPELRFRLKQQQLIELIRADRVDEALQFAQQELAPACGDVAELLQDLEETMALLVFKDAPGDPENVATLLEPAQREKTADALNAALLGSQSRPPEARMIVLLKLLNWAQEQLQTHDIPFTRLEVGELLGTTPPPPPPPSPS